MWVSWKPIWSYKTDYSPLLIPGWPQICVPLWQSHQASLLSHAWHRWHQVNFTWLNHIYSATKHSNGRWNWIDKWTYTENGSTWNIAMQSVYNNQACRLNFGAWRRTRKLEKSAHHLDWSKGMLRPIHETGPSFYSNVLGSLALCPLLPLHTHTHTHTNAAGYFIKVYSVLHSRDGLSHVPIKTVHNVWTVTLECQYSKDLCLRHANHSRKTCS